MSITNKFTKYLNLDTKCNINNSPLSRFQIPTNLNTNKLKHKLDEIERDLETYYMKQAEISYNKHKQNN